MHCKYNVIMSLHPTYNHSLVVQQTRRNAENKKEKMPSAHCFTAMFLLHVSQTNSLTHFSSSTPTYQQAFL